MTGSTERAGVAVVGGGIMGASIAYHLAARGVRDVILLERLTLASGPTGRSTAIVREHYSQPLLVRMASWGRRAYEAFAEEVGRSAAFVRTGLLVCAAEGDRAALERNAELGRSLGVATGLVGQDELAAIDPRIDGEGLVCCFEPEAGACDPYLATVGYAEAAQRAGARVEEGRRVLAIAPGRVETDGGPVEVGAIVVAAGPWTPALLEPLGFELPLVAARAEVGRFRLPADEPAPPALADFSQLFYSRPAGGGMLEVGSLDPRDADVAVDPDACPDGAEPETLRGFHAALARRVRGLGRGHWRGSWSGVYDVTPDWHPALGAVPGAETVYVAAGFSGHGFKLAPAVGLALTELVVGGRAETFDLAPLDPGRFARGELLTSRYGYSVLA